MDDLRVDTHHLSLERKKWVAYDFDRAFSESVESLYRAGFRHARQGQLRGEGTPTYLASPLACRRIATHCPDSRFIVLLRHPTERLLSHYHFEVQRCAVNAPLYGALQHALVEAAATGHYLEHLKRWFSLIPREQFLILPFEEWSRNGAEYDARICQFLGVPPFELSSASKRANITASPRSPVAHRFLGHVIQELRAQRFALRHRDEGARNGVQDRSLRVALRATRRVQRALLRPGRRPDPSSEALRPLLDRYYERHNRGLSELTGYDFASLWSLDV